jgi:hypothetical protein
VTHDANGVLNGQSSEIIGLANLPNWRCIPEANTDWACAETGLGLFDAAVFDPDVFDASYGWVATGQSADAWAC